jgi:hypothetical protein
MAPGRRLPGKVLVARPQFHIIQPPAQALAGLRAKIHALQLRWNGWVLQYRIAVSTTFTRRFRRSQPVSAERNDKPMQTPVFGYKMPH